MKLSDALLCLLLVTKAFFVECGEKKFWQVTSPYTQDKQISMNQCLLKCEKSESKINAVLADDGTCSCDHLQYAPSSIYMYREGQNRQVKYLIFSPFTSNFKSMGSENVVETIHGTAMQFSEDGPVGFPAEKKALKLKATKVGSTVNYFSYNIPQSLRDKVEASGMIITLWMKFTSVAETRPIFDFRISAVRRMHFYQYDRKFWLGLSGPSQGIGFAEALDWHHISLVFRKNPNKCEIRNDGVVMADQLHNGLEQELSNTLSFGYYMDSNGVEIFADAAIYCFTMQELGTKTDAEIKAAIEETKGACDQY